MSRAKAVQLAAKSMNLAERSMNLIELSVKAGNYAQSRDLIALTTKLTEASICHFSQPPSKKTHRISKITKTQYSSILKDHKKSISQKTQALEFFEDLLKGGLEIHLNLFNKESHDGMTKIVQDIKLTIENSDKKSSLGGEMVAKITQPNEDKNNESTMYAMYFKGNQIAHRHLYGKRSPFFFAPDGADLFVGNCDPKDTRLIRISLPENCMVQVVMGEGQIHRFSTGKKEMGGFSFHESDLKEMNKLKGGNISPEELIKIKLDPDTMAKLTEEYSDEKVQIVGKLKYNDVLPVLTRASSCKINFSKDASYQQLFF